MDSSFGNGSPRANTSPQDIDLLHEIAPGLDYSNMVTNPILWLVAKKISFENKWKNSLVLTSPGPSILTKLIVSLSKKELDLIIHHSLQHLVGLWIFLQRSSKGT